MTRMTDRHRESLAVGILIWQYITKLITVPKRAFDYAALIVTS